MLTSHKDGFSDISYHVHSVKRDIRASSDNDPNEHIQKDDLSTIEAHLRAQGYLVITVPAKRIVWTFERVEPGESMRHQLVDLTHLQLHGYVFNRIFHGVFKAADLSKYTSRTMIANNAPSLLSPTPLPPNMRATQAANARAFQQNAQAGTSLAGNADLPQIDPAKVYTYIVCAVAGTVLYQLARQGLAIPLNYRSFAHVTTRSPDDGETAILDQCLWLSTLNIYLSSAGTLVISANVVRRADVRRVDQLRAIPGLGPKANALLRVAPNGLLARCVLDKPVSTEGILAERIQRKRSRTIPADEGIEAWKRAVKLWLSKKGLYSDDFGDNMENWIQIRLSRKGTVATLQNSGMQAHQTRECLWPASLCFCYINLRTSIHQAQEQTENDALDPYTAPPNDAIGWFRSSDRAGFQDSLGFAQEWWLGQPERDKVAEARQQARQVVEEDMSMQVDLAGGFPSSPLQSRIGAYMDMQAASGVYPTPPDGILSQGLVATQPNDGSTLPSGNGDGSYAQASTAGFEHPGDPAEIGLGVSDAQTNAFPQINSDVQPDINNDNVANDDHDDLFSDVDGDVFDGGNDITDADFSFFDEPDAGNIDEVIQQDGHDAADDRMQGLEMSEVQSLANAENHDAAMHDEGVPGTQTLEVTSGRATPDAIMEGEGAAQIMDTSNREVTTTAAPHQDGGPATDQQVGESQPPKVPSPPLSPVMVRKKLFSSPKEVNAASGIAENQFRNKRVCVFQSVPFNSKLAASDSKYSVEGQFAFKADVNSSQHLSNGNEPGNQSRGPRPSRIDISLHPSETKNTLRDVSHPGPECDSKSFTSSFVTSKQLLGSTSNMEGTSDSDSEVSSSEASSRSAETSHRAMHLTVGKRKWADYDDVLDSGPGSSKDTILDESSQDQNQHSSIAVKDIPNLLNSFEPDYFDWSLADCPPPIDAPKPTTWNTTAQEAVAYHSPTIIQTPEADSPATNLVDWVGISSRDMIGIAQLVADQVIAGSLDILQEVTEPLALPNIADLSCEDIAYDPGPVLQKALQAVFPAAEECDLIKYATIQDVVHEPPQPAKGQPRQVQRRANTVGVSSGESGKLPSNSAFTIPPPHIRVRRGDVFWDLLPPSLSFWEPLGLGPINGPKNIIAYCIYPSNDDLAGPVSTFLDSLGAVYESCRLGTHSRGQQLADYAGGLVPVRVDSPVTYQTAMRALRDTCASLGTALSAIDTDPSTVDVYVVYLINPFEDPGALSQLCACLWALFEACKDGAQSRSAPRSMRDVVPQIIPIKYIASASAPVVLEPSTMTKLAREVYDRCPPCLPSEDRSALRIYSAVSFQLEETLPKNIQFKLVADPPSDLLHEYSHLHLGYARSFDGDWITTAWTDNAGKNQATVSYCLRGGRTFVEVAREIWSTTVEIMQGRRVTWRLGIARAGVMDREETEAWMSLATSPAPLVIGTTLISVETSPPITLTANLAPPGSNPPAATPASTPQPGVSPDAHGLTPAATPPDLATDLSKDPDAYLVDVTDETWGIILSHRLNNSNSLVEYRPSLASGLLIKRGSDSGETRGPLCIAVNVLWFCSNGRGGAGAGPDGQPFGMGQGVGPPPRPATESMLREYLNIYRGLGLLAKLKGMRGTKGGTVPWHVAAAMTGVKALEMCI